MGSGKLQAIEWTPLRRVLARLMSALSEESHCAGWMVDTEFALWALVVGDPVSKLWAAGSDEIAGLRELAELTGSWIAWAEGWREERPVALGDWIEVYAARSRT
jgi:hypothetical protein